MYATIRHHPGAPPPDDALARAWRALAAAPGFVACLLLETQDGGHASVCIFEDRASLEDADRLVAGWLVAHIAVPGPDPPQLTAGEVIAQRGL